MIKRLLPPDTVNCAMCEGHGGAWSSRDLLTTTERDPKKLANTWGGFPAYARRSPGKWSFREWTGTDGLLYGMVEWKCDNCLGSGHTPVPFSELIK